MKVKKLNGVLFLEKVEFDQVLERVVMKNNKTSGKITLPKDLINEKVYVVVPKGDKNGK